MTTTSVSVHSERDAIRAARAAYVRDCLRGERWSGRAAALALGMTHTSLGSRLRAETSFMAEELEGIAVLLKRDAVEFYGAYLAAGYGKGPASEETGPAIVPPTGVEPATYGTNVRRLIPRVPARLVPGRERAAKVTSIKGERVA